VFDWYTAVKKLGYTYRDHCGIPYTLRVRVALFLATQAWEPVLVSLEASETVTNPTIFWFKLESENKYLSWMIPCSQSQLKLMMSMFARKP